MKTSSIYLKEDFSKAYISDFGPVILMKDHKTKIREPSSLFDYQAPEVIDSNYLSFNLMSDIWSIGTIILDVCTTSLYDVS